jgi:type II secretory pathway component PulC
MRKISIGNLFKKSESGGNKTGKILFILLIIIIAAGAFYWWGYPLLFPESVVKSPTTSVAVTTYAPTATTSKVEVEPVVKEKTEFEIEMEKRKQGYEEKIFVYEPYEPPSNRNPFQKVSTSYFLEETEEKEEEEGSVLRFQKPVLPPGTKLTGIIGSKDNRVAIIEMNSETFIANLYDILLDRYIVKEIKNDEVIIDYNGYFFSVKIGGEDLSDEL